MSGDLIGEKGAAARTEAVGVGKRREGKTAELRTEGRRRAAGRRTGDGPRTRVAPMTGTCRSATIVDCTGCARESHLPSRRDRPRSRAFFRARAIMTPEIGSTRGGGESVESSRHQVGVAARRPSHTTGRTRPDRWGKASSW